MEKEQEVEWLEAQKTPISVDLVAAAKQQLEFLAAVDRQRSLYDDGKILNRAIHRYKTCWLPLLAKHTGSGVFEGFLVVPLDCEWIWHCHRLNPVQYRKDCKEFYGRILDNKNVVSSVQEDCKYQTAEIWEKLYPGEPFELDYANSLSSSYADMCSGTVESITYDLFSAVKRQSTFYHQVARPSMHDSCFLEGAVARYKGFLHLIKRNQERSMKCFCVPTYDIDLIWHSHQLQPLSYCKDMVDLLGKVLEHDDTDSDRTKGKKLDVGFSESTKQWEDAYGLRYWRAGAMYRGSAPSPLKLAPFFSNIEAVNTVISDKTQQILPLSQTMVVEVLLEIVGVRNLPDGQKGSLFVSFSKRKPDMFFNGSCMLSILSESGEKQVAGFECEPSGELVLELMTNSTSKISMSLPSKTIGTTSIPLQDFMDQNSKLSVEKWFALKPHPGNVNSKPIYLRVAASITVPVQAPYLLHMVKSRPISLNTCLFPLLGKVQQTRSWTCFQDENCNSIISLQMRNVKEKKLRNSSISKKVVGVTGLSRKPCLLAECRGNTWSLKDSDFSLCIEKTKQDDCILHLKGHKQIKLLPGRKLEYEPKISNLAEATELDFITVVEFSRDNPYGKAIALLDTKSCLIKVNEESFVLFGILLIFILKKEGYAAKNIKEKTELEVETSRHNSKDLSDSPNVMTIGVAVTKTGSTVKSGGCGGGCSGGCGNVVRSGGCGSGCGGGCGNVVRSGGCGSGCGGGCGSRCGSIVQSNGSGDSGGGCGSGCGGKCGVAIKSSGCGGGCGGGCGNGLVGDKSGGCGSGCGNCGVEVSDKGVTMANNNGSLISA